MTHSNATLSTRDQVFMIASWQTVASVCFYTVFSGTAIFRAQFGLSRTLTGTVVTVTMLGYSLFLFPMGSLTDGYGDRPLMIGGLIGLSIALVSISLANGYVALLVAVFFLGAAYATAMPATNNAVFSRIPPQRQNFAMGIKQVGVTIGSAVSSILITQAAATYDWRLGFLVAVSGAAVVVVVFVLFYDNTSGNGSAELPDLRALASHSGYLRLLGGGFFLGAAMFTTVGYVVVYTTDRLGSAVALGGIALATMQLTGSGGRVLMGELLDRIPKPTTKTASVILTIQAVAAATLFCLLPLAKSETEILVAFAALGFPLLGFTGIYYSCLGTLVPDDAIGEATAGGQIALNLGAVVAPPTFSYVVSHTSYTVGWVGLAGSCLSAGGFLLAVLHSRRSTDAFAIKRALRTRHEK